jgi:hypothetical protein
MSISNIDDLLMGIGNSQQPETPENKGKVIEKAPAEEIEEELPEYDDTEDQNDNIDESNDDSGDDSEESDEKSVKKSDSEVEESETEDEYGNKKERMSKGMQDRLDRKEKQHQREIEQRDMELQQLRQQLATKGASSEVQQAVKDFKYDQNEEAGWEQQLSEFVKKTINSVQTEKEQNARDHQEQRASREFHQKFSQGMERFDDFVKVVSSQPIDNEMTLALRGMSDPSAFIYAASKRHPQELDRISKLSDPYARVVEMGKLEERMRRNKTTTKTPRPLGRTREDATIKVKAKERDTSGDDLLAKADAKRLSTVRARHKSNR